jgi:hypothetical protein
MHGTRIRAGRTAIEMWPIFMGTKGVVDQPKEHELVLIPCQKSCPRAFASVKVKESWQEKAQR